ncbi:DNA glycosylase [Multifurca ochricompacta]|uniref:DNA-(apurinic or apyrimidinic site) lyase n=1 Tax=Multifurca ochricompacta TaxID=376703 RepID=A0AAD4MB35_9AGAM|nr:DNA glycosylase [Multifurca ochricompacta]
MAAQVGFHVLPLPLAQLSLAAVLKCGQSFRWSIYPLRVTSPSDPSHEYRLCLQDRVVCLRQSPEILFYRSVFPELLVPPEIESARNAETLLWLKDYFQLDIDLVKLYDEWSERDPVFAKLRWRFEGIRMLRQDPWENLISFICSSNNNITRITKMVKSLCTHYSPPLLSIAPPTTIATGILTPSESDGDPSYVTATSDPEPESVHPFPPPSRLSAPDVATTLRSLGFGYRADFIQKTAKMLMDAHGESPSEKGNEGPERWLHTLRDMSTEDARGELLKLMGVGRKVADCILLMSLDKPEVIPVDTHVHQIAMKHYGFRGVSGAKQAMSPKLYDVISERFHGVWGDYAGWAHSVLFTADLKAFSDYGLLTPVPTPGKQGATVSQAAEDYFSAPSHSARKRRAKQMRTLDTCENGGASHVEISPSEAGSLAERVKKRRRVLKAHR